jgi:hypothetical protein
MNRSASTVPSFASAARQLRRDYVASLLTSAFCSLGNVLRAQHEAGLRRASRAVSPLKSVNGTPA